MDPEEFDAFLEEKEEEEPEGMGMSISAVLKAPLEPRLAHVPPPCFSLGNSVDYFSSVGKCFTHGKVAHVEPGTGLVDLVIVSSNQLRPSIPYKQIRIPLHASEKVEVFYEGRWLGKVRNGQQNMVMVV